MSKLREFYIDKDLKNAVFDHITEYAKEKLIEDAMKENNTIWFNRLMIVLGDSDRALEDMFEVTPEKKPLNPAK